MTSQMSLEPKDLLDAFGGIIRNDLIHILDLTPTGNLDDGNNIFIPKPSNYFDMDGMITFLKTHHGKFTVLSLNARSIFDKHSAILSILEELHENNLSFDVVCVQECWLKENIDIHSLNINNYKMIHQGYNPECSTRGGLVCYVNEELSPKITLRCNNFKTWEGLFFEVKIDNLTKITIGNIYRPPHDLIFNDFIREFFPVIDKLNKSAVNLLVTGDFNINLLRVNSNNKYNNFFDIMTGLNLVPTITFPTRFPEKQSEIHPSLIDQIYLKNSYALKSAEAGILYRPVSDHLPYFIAMKLSTKNAVVKPKFIQTQVKTVTAHNNFMSELSSIDWTKLFDHQPSANPLITYKSFKKKLLSLQEKHFPMKKVKYNKYKHKLSNWITKGILESLKFRDKLYRKLNSTRKGTPLFDKLKTNLHTYNSILNKTKREAKTTYYKKKFDENKFDNRKTWDTIREVINKPNSKSQLPSYFIHNNDCLTDPYEIADKFNDFFVNIGPNLADVIETHDKPPFATYLQTKVESTFLFETINEQKTTKIISDMKTKSSCGIDKMSLELLKACSALIVSPLTAIINQSLTSGIFPDELKTAKILPIYKKEDEHFFDNYRPISLLPSISKVFEKIAHQQLFSYLSRNKLLYKHQYGFREDHSTELAVLEFLDRIYSHLDAGNIPISVFLDLSKAFDTIDHNILCSKLTHYGIGGTELNWFRSYLTDRSQYVSYNGSCSELNKITTGVPQGSILGPLLFTIYMNDICYASNFHSILYADDTTLINPICTHDSAEIINEELNKVCNWLAVNKLSLNAKKTKYMTFHWHQNTAASLIRPIIQIQGHKIDKVSHFKFLGITLDTNLNWNEHVTELGNKLSRTSGVLSKLKNYIPSEILHTIYNSLFQSHLNYGITCWGFNNCERIIKLQKRAIRNVVKSKYNAHTEPIFKNLKILKWEDIFRTSCLKIYYKFHNNTLPDYFSNFPFISIEALNNERIHTRPKRVRTLPDRYGDSQTELPNPNPIIQISLTNKSNSRKCIRHFIPKLINDLYIPELAREKVFTHSSKGFNTYVKNIIFLNYSAGCLIANCHVCKCK
jgi:hypothetical protein